ncbi:MAG TPA: DUF2807 domain-containing protein [Sphingomicrobium sp.]|nr:DUF2807 domain-containing protein [Sphingomicrobium sp.]
MRLHLLGLSAAVMLATPAQAVTRNYTVTGFERVRIDGPYRVKLTTGVPPFANASGSTAALEAVSVEVVGRMLIVRRKSAKATAAEGPVTISLGTHELTAAWLNGSGGLAIDGVKGHAFQLGVSGSGVAEVGKVSVDRLQVSVSGSGSVGLGGTAQAANFSVSGPSSVQAAELSAKAAKISAQGSPTVRLTATETADVNARGLAVVELSGKPACTIRPTSTAEVHGCR